MLQTVTPRWSKSCGCRCTFGCWTSRDFCLDCERGNNAATGPNCRFDFIRLQWKLPRAVILNTFCPLSLRCLFNHFVLTGHHSCQNKWPCLAMDTLFSTSLWWNKHLHTVHETIRNWITEGEKKKKRSKKCLWKVTFKPDYFFFSAGGSDDAKMVGNKLQAGVSSTAS